MSTKSKAIIKSDNRKFISNPLQDSIIAKFLSDKKFTKPLDFVLALRQSNKKVRQLFFGGYLF
jgi:hypothetical protein